MDSEFQEAVVISEIATILPTEWTGRESGELFLQGQMKAGSHGNSRIRSQYAPQSF